MKKKNINQQKKKYIIYLKKMKVKITKGNSKYFYTTEEIVKICPICKTEYKRRKFCLKCWKSKKVKIPTKDHIKERDGWISKDLTKYSCSCIFGSFFSWAGFWKKNYPEVRCKHCKWSMKKIKNEKRDNTDDSIDYDNNIPMH